MKGSNKTKSYKTTSHIYTRKDYKNKDGMLTTVWGPSTWHLLHTISFNYPIDPTIEEKRHYRNFILNLKHVLPCGKCRDNLVKNFARMPLTEGHMKSRATFSRYIYRLHELINRMLKKKSELSYNQVKERYENFRARCALPYTELQNQLSLDANGIKKSYKDLYLAEGDKTDPKSAKEKGCTEPIYGEKSKCVLHIVPQSTKCETFQVDDKCIKKKIDNI